MRRYTSKKEQHNLSVEFADEFMEIEDGYVATEIAGGKMSRKINETQEKLIGLEKLSL